MAKWHERNPDYKREWLKRNPTYNRDVYARSRLSEPLVWVYELWGADGCLYVGKTNNWPKRRTAHNADPKLKGCKYVVLNMSVDDELSKIQELKPTHNKIGAIQ